MLNTIDLHMILLLKPSVVQNIFMHTSLKKLVLAVDNYTEN